jgi:hypothetical protein
MNKLITSLILSLFLSTIIYSQEWFSLPTYWEVKVPNGIYNIEAADINRDGHLDIVSGNFNDTYVYFGGPTLLDTAKDIVYKGRCLAITDYNGDGIPDMITMHYTKFDSSSRYDYDGDLLFYFGKNTGQYLFDTVPDYSFPLPTLYPHNEEFSTGNFKPGIRVGDLNHDGKMDIVINSYAWHQGRGKLYIYMGKDIPTGIPDFNIEPNLSRGLSFGEFYEVGDINGDQYDDLLISQYIGSIAGPSSDSLALLYVYYGSQNQSYDINNPSILYKSKVDSYNYTADWFLIRFSLDDINCDGLKDLVVCRVPYNPDGNVTVVHYGRTGFDGFDTIPNLKLKTPDPEFPNVIVGRGLSQNIGDFNSDGYNDFILNGAGMSFWLILGGPHISNANPYGCRGFISPNLVFPFKALPVGSQTTYNRNDFIANVLSDDIGWGHILMFIGNNTVHTDVKREVDTTNNNKNILQVYPNPFNSQIRISYTIKTRGHVNLKLYNSLGQEIEQLKNEEENAGQHEINYMNSKIPSGIYFLTLNHSGEIITQKIVLTK